MIHWVTLAGVIYLARATTPANLESIMESYERTNELVEALILGQANQKIARNTPPLHVSMWELVRALNTQPESIDTKVGWTLEYTEPTRMQIISLMRISNNQHTLHRLETLRSTLGDADASTIAQMDTYIDAMRNTPGIMDDLPVDSPLIAVTKEDSNQRTGQPCIII